MTFDVRSKLAEFAASIEMDLAEGLDDMSETTKKIREEIVAAFPAPEEQETLEALRDGLAHVIASKKGLDKWREVSEQTVILAPKPAPTWGPWGNEGRQGN